MGDAPPTDYQSTPTLKEKAGVQWRRALTALRRVPYLTTIFALTGLAIFCWLTYQHGNNLLKDTPEAWSLRYKVTLHNEFRSDLVQDFFHSHWSLGAKCLLPALILAFIRQRGKQFQLALTMLTLAVLARWTFDEVSTGWESAHNSMMGEVPAPEAFYFKLGLISTTLLSIL